MKRATTTEITRHMITAMTIPTYRATSSVLGATGGHGGGGRRRDTKQREKNSLLRSHKFISIALNVLSQYAGVVMKPLSAD